MIQKTCEIFTATDAREERISFDKDSLSEGRNAFLALRAQAERNGVQDLTLDEINEEIYQTMLSPAQTEYAQSHQIP